MQSDNKEKIKVKHIVVAVSIVVIFAIIVYNVFASQKVKREKETAINTVSSIAQSYELENVSVALRSFSYDGYNWFYADVTCSNWGSFTPKEMLSEYQKMDSAVSNANLRIGKEKWVSLGNIYSDGDMYKIYSSSNSVYKNGDNIYDDWEHSSSHADAQKNSSKSKGSSDVLANGDSKDSYGHDKFDAFVIAEKAVKEKLKSPSTAQFCTTTEATIGRNGNTWTVKGWVDAQNGYGATVRANFVVTFTFASKDTYSVALCTVS